MPRRWLVSVLAALPLIVAACSDEDPITPPPPPPPSGPQPHEFADYIVWTSTRDGNAEIYGARFAHETAHNLSDNPAADYSPALLRHHNKILFVSDRDGPSEIYLHDLVTDAVTRLTHNNVPDDQPAWSSDGDYIAFVREVSPGNTEIFTMWSNGTNEVRLTNSPGQDIQPDWRPNANELVFASDRDKKYADGYLEVYRMRSDGSDVRRLTHNDDGIDYYPKWSPDGALIAFTTHRPGLNQCYSFALEVFVMESDGSNPRTVSNHCRGDAGAAWITDHVLVILSDRDDLLQYAWDLYWVPLGGGPVSRLTTTGQEAGPNGR
jgi:Tol biopolymer transport system component